ncbi:surface-adhesin E family protein [Geotalea uraniireducens]|uniref:Surface-adhesin protein E-like domain-containing protein n=1 Tax=Geotalea uraniireducens (strain Rf4) TaxID=351605 RepID=A5G8U7_GEOUR|nr:surface-adhesin E family protein [Geotalea uraniireducens]ABQ28215.1 hypothetical protein Gura_4072 [Geotalea uraniireducens Rf4]
MKTRFYLPLLLIWVFVLLWATGGAIADDKAPKKEEATWVLLHSEPEHSEFFYNKAALSVSPEDTFTVWTKVVYGKAGKADMLEGLSNVKTYQDLAYTLYQYGMNCATRQSRLQQIIHFDSKGNRIAEFNLTGKTEWEEITPDSRLDMVAEAECMPGAEP